MVLVYDAHRRFSERWETTNIQVSYNTPLEVIEELRTGIRKYVNENNREWSNMDLNIDKMDFQNSIQLIVAMERAFYLLSFHLTPPTHA